MGIWNDGTGMPTASLSHEFKPDNLQELFTRKNPFHDCVGASAILGSIMAGSLNRPNDEDTYHRMSDAWWNILAKCWNHEPSSRPTISYVMKNIAALVRVVFAMKFTPIDLFLQEIGGRDLPSSENVRDFLRSMGHY